MAMPLGEMKAWLAPERRKRIECRADEIESHIKSLQALRVTGASTQAEVGRPSPRFAGG